MHVWLHHYMTSEPLRVDMASGRTVADLRDQLFRLLGVCPSMATLLVHERVLTRDNEQIDCGARITLVPRMVSGF